MAEKKVVPTELEKQQTDQIKEMGLIIKALEASNNLLGFRFDVVANKNKELQAKVVELTPAPKNQKLEKIN